MGRHQKPSRMKVLEGTRADRVNHSEPQSPEGLGEPPDHLSGYGLVAWEDVRTALETMKIATQADRQVIAIYCEAYRRWRDCLEIVQYGRVVETTGEVRFDPRGKAIEGPPIQVIEDKGYIREKLGVHEESKYLKIAERAEDRMIRIAMQYGLTAVSRAGIHVNHDEGGNELVSFVVGESKKKA